MKRERKTKSKILSLILSVFMIITMMPVTAFADESTAFDFQGGEVTWSYDGSGVMTVSGTGTASTAGSDFEQEYISHKGDIKKIIIEEGITGIGEGFSDCTNLTEVVLPQSLTDIADNAFGGCPENCVYRVYRDSYADMNFDAKIVGVKEYIDAENEAVETAETTKETAETIESAGSAGEVTNPLISFSIDKKVMSEGETATITVEMVEGYTANWIYIYRPITKNFDTVYLYKNSDGVYTGTFNVSDQTESGIWRVKYFTYQDSNNDYQYLYNTETNTGTQDKTIDFSSMDFEVVGTNADITDPVLKSFEIDKKTVSAGETITVSALVEDEHPNTEITLYYKQPSGKNHYIFLNKVDDTALYRGELVINKDTEIGQWKPYRFDITDANGNGGNIYNSEMISYDWVKQDLSGLNFEVINTSEENPSESQDSFIVIFKDGNGNTLSTQRVAKGDSAVEPEIPTKEMYIFDGWDTDFSNITSNQVITAKWKIDPDVVYDHDIHVGGSFEFTVSSTVDQVYDITCNEDIEFTSNQTGMSTIFGDQVNYLKTYKVTVNTPGSYLFYVKGNWSSNTLTYKVRVSEHNWDDNFTVDVNATCERDGIESIHCKGCGIVKEGSQRTITATGHAWSKDYAMDMEPTCTEQGLKSIHCDNCGAVKDQVAIPAKGHSYREFWNMNDIMHWKECGCGATTDEAYHSFEWVDNNGLMDQTCSECGYVKNASCLYEDIIVGESKEITLHFESDTNVTVDSDDPSIAFGNVSGYSTIIGNEGILYSRTITIIPSKVGTTRLTISSDGYIAKQYCIEVKPSQMSIDNHIGGTSIFEYVSLHDEGFKYNNTDNISASLISKTQQTSTTTINGISSTITKYIYKLLINYKNPGEFIYSIFGNVSGEIYRINANISDHSWDADYTVDKEATCTETGSKSIHCKECNATKEAKTIDKKAHTYGNWITDINATCTEKGSKHKTCSVCGDTVTEAIAAVEHTWNTDYTIDKAATCTEDGSMSIHCRNCDAKKNVTEIKATGHIYKTQTKKATATKNGYTKKVCSCGDVQSTSKIYYPKTVKLSTSTYTYNGKVKKPSVKIYNSAGKLISASNYTVKYAAGRKNVGKYKVTVTFKTTSKYYSGSKYAYLKINPKGTSISSVTKASKAFTAKWKKQSSKMATSRITGYQIRYSTSSKMTNAKTVTIKGYTKTSKKISKLKSKKTYYVQVRTYKTVSGTHYYSTWSKAKAVKTK